MENGGQPAGKVRVDVRDERRYGHALELRRQGGCGGEDVRDHDVGVEGSHELPRDPGGADGRLIGLQRPLAGREDQVLGRGGEGHARGLGRLAPAFPGLDAHLVAAGEELRTEGDHGERMPGSPNAPSRTFTSGSARSRPSPARPKGSTRAGRWGATPEPVEVLGGRAVGRPQLLAHEAAHDHLALGAFEHRARDALAPARRMHEHEPDVRDRRSVSSRPEGDRRHEAARGVERQQRPGVVARYFSAEFGGVTGIVQPGGIHSR